jgi:hypothetical protein
LILLYKNGDKIIVTAFARNAGKKLFHSMFTGDLEVIHKAYIESNKEQFYDDWVETARENNIEHRLLQQWEFEDDAELQSYENKIKEQVRWIETGNNGKPFDYDLCLFPWSFGGNSNTVQKYLYQAMGLDPKLDSVEKSHLPGIDGVLYDGPLDNWVDKYFVNFIRKPKIIEELQDL